MLRITKKALMIGAFSLATVCGIAMAAGGGGDAYEFEYYDGAGNLVGIRGNDCDFGFYRWGRITENAVYYDYGSCL